jgi:hypothetical protein
MCSAVFFKPAVDRIAPFYYERVPEPMLIEASWNGQNNEADWSSGREILLEDTLKIWLYLQGRLKPLSSTVARTIDDFAAHIADTLNLSGLKQTFVERMVVHVQRCRDLPPLLMRALRRVKSRLAFVHMASYMGITAPITRTLHDAGFTVVEAQHGQLAFTTTPYNFSHPCLQHGHPAHYYLPDIFLTFGDFWGENIRLPAKKVVIGFPHLAEDVVRLSNVQDNPKHVLVISQWTISEKLSELISQTAHLLPDYHFIYKLHPREAQLAFDTLRAVPNVEILRSGNVHDWIAGCGIIAGYNSTVLAEALAFSRKRLFILTNNDLPKGMGYEFSDARTLAEGILQPGTGFPSIDPKTFWADNWQMRIDSFFGRHLSR